MKNLILLFVISCYACTGSIDLIRPANLNDGIANSVVADVGMDSLLIHELLLKINDKTFEGINSLLIAKNNKLVVENYFNGVTPDSLQHLYSAGKSIVSMVVGLAVDQGIIKNTDEKLLDFFKKNYPYVQNNDARKKAIALRHLLSMSTGISCGDFRNGTDITPKMLQRLNSLKYYLDLPMKYTPGENFVYTDSGPIITRAIISRATEQKYSDFEIKYLLEPLGITSINEHRDYRARDQLKFGLLMANNGVWHGRRILSEKWIEESTSIQIVPTWSKQFAEGYGYFWWIKNFEHKNNKVKCFMAAGNGQQFIYVIPELELVIVLTGSNFNRPDLNGQPHNIVQNYILKSIL